MCLCSLQRQLPVWIFPCFKGTSTGSLPLIKKGLQTIFNLCSNSIYVHLSWYIWLMEDCVFIKVVSQLCGDVSISIKDKTKIKLGQKSPVVPLRGNATVDIVGLSQTATVEHLAMREERAFASSMHACFFRREKSWVGTPNTDFFNYIFEMISWDSIWHNQRMHFIQNHKQCLWYRQTASNGLSQTSGFWN